MVTLIDPILSTRPPAYGIELSPLREPESMTDDRMELTAMKHRRSFEWAGHRSALPGVARQMEKYGWTVSIREARPA
jgi:hypothetical protein